VGGKEREIKGTIGNGGKGKDIETTYVHPFFGYDICLIARQFLSILFEANLFSYII